MAVEVYRPKGNPPAFDLRGYLYEMAGVDSTQVDGLDVVTMPGSRTAFKLHPSLRSGQALELALKLFAKVRVLLSRTQ